jgi:NHLM bacteriocin system ABC transporter peptidase/ATP-binding protein
MGNAGGTNEKPKALRVKRSHRVRTPTVIQMESTECGAAALAMVLGYYGRFLSLDRLRVECGVSRDGSKAVNILKVARKYGLTAAGLREGEPEGLKKLDLPVIVFWKFDHFLVVDGYNPNEWYVNDPAMGPRRISADEFDQGYTGIALTFKPGPDFRKGGKKPSMLRALGRRSRGLGVPLLYAVVAGLALAVLGLVIPTFSKVFVDKYLIGGMHDWVRPLLWAMGMTVILHVGLTWFQQSILLRLEIKLALATSSKFFRHVLRLPIEFFTHRYDGEIGSRVALNDEVAKILSGQLGTSILHCLTGIFFVLVMFQYDVILTLVGITIAMTNLLALRYVSRKRRDLNKRLLQEKGKLIGISMGGILTIETLKSTGGESDFFSTWAGYQAKTVNSEQELDMYTQFLTAIPALLTALTTMAILGLGGLRVIEGYLTIGDLVAFQLLMVSFTTPFNNLVALGGQLQEADGDLQRLDDVLENEPDRALARSEQLEYPPDGPVKLTGHLELRGVSFGYSPLEDPLIEDFSLTLNPGSRVALVGTSGSGKSTLAMLVAGLLDPWKGDILFDGASRAEIPRSIMNDSVSMVNQDIILFEGTIKENLTLWDKTIPDESVIRAARDACIHDVIAARTGGYDYPIEEGGRNFSGGQRQRLEIARALALHPSLVIMDEATSALDPLTERAIDDNLRRRGCTCLIVAHRLSTIRDCDEIIVLDKGKVVERGTHELMSRNDGPYAQLIKEY